MTTLRGQHADNAHGHPGVPFAVVTVGCPKNEADSDALVALLTREGGRQTAPEAAALLIVNTCGFIDAAKEESIDAVLGAVALGQETGARIAVMGCLVSLYEEELKRELPEVDVWATFDEAPLVATLRQCAAAAPQPQTHPRRGRQRPVHAFIKISDGCDHRCAYCSIPLIKGSYRTEKPEAILAAARRAVRAGAQELVLVGQDTSSWHFPGYGGLARLLADLKALGEPWLRLMYLQPEGVDEALLDALAHYAVPYVDLPLQHASATVLKRMGRWGDGETYMDLLDTIRRALPGVAIRSTFLVGHPGEGQEEFDGLLHFVRAAGLAVAGVFVFDPQVGTAAATWTDRVAPSEAAARAAALAAEIEAAAAPFWSGLVGSELDVLVERGTNRAAGEGIGRIHAQAPDVDGTTTLRGAVCRRGDLVRARIVEVTGWDLHAEAL